MKHPLLLILFWLSALFLVISGVIPNAAAGASRLNAMDNASLYNRANQYYAAKDYQNALNLYTELAERGVLHPYLYYNLGNTYFMLGKTGYALLYFEKALKLKPFDRDIKKNLEYANQAAQENIYPLYSEGFFKYLRRAASYLKPKVLAWIELFFFTLFIALFHLYLFFPALRPLLKNRLIVGGIFFLVLLTATIAYRVSEKRYPRGITVEKEVEVKDAPLAESEVRFILYEGSKTKTIEKRGEWIRILVADGREGWIVTESIRFI